MAKQSQIDTAIAALTAKKSAFNDSLDLAIAELRAQQIAKPERAERKKPGRKPKAPASDNQGI